jgi:quinol monooxygenase YgiN
MFASVRRYRFTSGSLDEHMRRADQEIAEDLRKMPGFVAYQVLELGDGEIMSITTFRDRPNAEASVERARDWVAALPEPVIEMTDSLVAEVVISHAESDFLEPEHY